MRAIIVADGDVRPGHALEQALIGAELVIAADGGALKAPLLGLRPDVVIGDGDSLPADRIADLRRDGVEVIIHPIGKEASDTELAVREAIARGATSLVICGAFGGTRLEHGIANLMLLAIPGLAGLDVVMVDGPTTVRVLGAAGPQALALQGTTGDFVSLLPLSELVAGVTTSGLRFPLNDETLHQGPSRGLSNEFLQSHAEVSVRSGRLAVMHTERGTAQ